jgi:hypothetical protein
MVLYDTGNGCCTRDIMLLSTISCTSTRPFATKPFIALEQMKTGSQVIDVGDVVVQRGNHQSRFALALRLISLRFGLTEDSLLV